MEAMLPCGSFSHVGNEIERIWSSDTVGSALMVVGEGKGIGTSRRLWYSSTFVSSFLLRAPGLIPYLSASAWALSRKGFRPIERHATRCFSANVRATLVNGLYTSPRGPELNASWNRWFFRGYASN